MAAEPGEVQHVVSGSTKAQLDRIMDDMETLGIVTELAGKVCIEHAPCILTFVPTNSIQ